MVFLVFGWFSYGFSYGEQHLGFSRGLEEIPAAPWTAALGRRGTAARSFRPAQFRPGDGDHWVFRFVSCQSWGENDKPIINGCLNKIILSCFYINDMRFHG